MSQDAILPELTVRTELRQLVKYAAAAGDFYELHYDLDFAHRLGHPDIALHGMLKAAYLGRVVTDWLGTRGDLIEFSVSYRGLDYRNRNFRCGGEVTAATGETARIELWGENDDRQRTTIGSAVVRFHEQGSH